MARRLSSRRPASRAGTRPTVAGVAAGTGVSRSWLYTQPDLIQVITEIQRRRPALSRSGRVTAASGESLRQRLEVSPDRNRQLREEIRDLHRRLGAAHGEIRRLRTLPGGVAAGAPTAVALAGTPAASGAGDTCPA